MVSSRLPLYSYAEILLLRSTAAMVLTVSLDSPLRSTAAMVLIVFSSFALEKYSGSCLLWARRACDQNWAASAADPIKTGQLLVLPLCYAAAAAAF